MTARVKTDYIVIHCAATPPTADIGVKEIDAWHRQKGWNSCGYHLVIRRNGVLEHGRGLDQVGAHVRGLNNRSVGVCLVGGIDANGKPEANFTDAQFAALRSTILSLTAIYPGAAIVGHRDVIQKGDPAKACPSFDVASWWHSA